MGEADTVLVAGTGEPYEPDPKIVAALREAAADGKRIASLCTGAFQLAEAACSRAAGPPPTGHTPRSCASGIRGSTCAGTCCTSRTGGT
ncbi:hypothetical protein GCM10010121_056890 [Streptomyces brasiliensis]|uniref:DJ-1/PfpI domain-containing protein n=1 Tax=Streptomyces brasiliensis TaxID=1954 RepID=A0A917L288_9ACTN|nr:hypothetical protein GCM10010121_056890 [Streptomyces brasiliensis]